MSRSTPAPSGARSPSSTPATARFRSAVRAPAAAQRRAGVRPRRGPGPPARHSRRHRDALRTRCRPACFHGAAERITRYAAGSATLESHGIWTLEVAGDLDVDPQPTVVAANARHFTTTRLQLTNSGRVRLRERIQIGRSNERQGCGLVPCTPTSTGHRCCGTASSSVIGRLQTTNSVRRWRVSANCTIPTAMSTQPGLR